MKHQLAPLSLGLATLLAFAVSSKLEAQCPEDPLFRRLGGGTPGALGVPTVNPVGLAVPGTSLGFQVVDAAPSSSGALYFGPNSTGILLPSLGATVYTFPFNLLTFFVTDTQGVAELPNLIESIGVGLCGLELVVQGYTLDSSQPSGIAVTDAVEFRVGSGLPQIRFGSSIAKVDLPEGVLSTLVAVDLDGDGFDDAVGSTSFPGDSNHFVMLSRGDGRFESPVALSVGAESLELLVVDITGDGEFDLVTLRNATGSNLLVFPGMGDGSFGPPAIENLAPNAVDFAVVDADVDGDLDIVFVDSLGNLNWRRQDGVGLAGWSPSLSIAVSTSGPRVMVDTADFDGDGTLEFWTIREDFLDFLEVHEFDGVNWQVTSEFPFPSDATLRGTLQFDADGLADIYAFAYPTLFVFRGTPQGGFTTESLQVGPPLGIRPPAQSVWVGDAMEIGRDQLVFMWEDFVSGATAYGTADPGPGIVSTIEVNHLLGPVMTVGEFDEVDGLDWLGIAGDYSILASNPRTRPSIQAEFSLVPFEASSMSTGDLNGDGALDLVTTSQRGMVRLLGNGDGSFQSLPALPTAGLSSQDSTLADVNGDGFDDLLYVEVTENELLYYENDGTGQFSNPVSFFCDFDPNRVRASDVNGDGFDDVVVTSRFAPNLRLFLGSASGLTLVNITAMSSPAAAVRSADLDGDGTEEVLVAHELGQVSVFEVTSSGLQLANTREFVGIPFADFGVADFDEDGNLDLVLSSPGSSVFRTLFGLGDKTFGPPALTSSAGGADLISETAYRQSDLMATGDVNLDGHVDLMFPASGLFSYVFMGRGDGTFEDEVPFIHQSRPVGALQLADFDSDGALDVALLSDSYTLHLTLYRRVVVLTNQLGTW